MKQRVPRRDLNKGDLVLRLRQDNRGRHKLSQQVVRPIYHRRGAQAWHVQAGERKQRSLHQCLEHTAATSLLSLEFRAICTSFVLAFSISRNNKGVCFTCLFFGNLPDPRGLGRARTLRYAWLYPRQSHASLGGYYGGNPRMSPKITNAWNIQQLRRFYP